MMEMLDFMEGRDPISKVKRLADTVALMMKQVEKCALFIQKYVSRGQFHSKIRETWLLV